MKRHVFFSCIGIVDKFFNTSSDEVADLVLTPQEHLSLCSQAKLRLQKIYPNFIKDIELTPVNDLEDPKEFAGYCLTYKNEAEEIEFTSGDISFDFGKYGILVIPPKRKPSKAKPKEKSTKTPKSE